jgi:transcriptional regulator with XRE-family HTH domain
VDTPKPERNGEDADDTIGVAGPPLELRTRESVFMHSESGEDTIYRILSDFEIGRKLRALRIGKKFGLKDLGKHTGLSASMLSQLENGKLIPTLPTLARIAMVFDVGLEHFLGDKHHRPRLSVVRAVDRMCLPGISGSLLLGSCFEVLMLDGLLNSLSCYLAEFAKTGRSTAESHAHEGAEFVHVTEGSLAIVYQSEEHILRAGDSVYFDSSELHSYLGKSDTPAKAVIVTSAPSPP